MTKKSILIIMDGWGEGSKTSSNVIYNSDVPFIKGLYNNKDWAYAQLQASGENVGLPDGQMGNSEVGHLNIGAGRIVYQDLVRINKSIEDNSIKNNKVINDAFNYAKKNNKSVHFLGLVSNGGVHSSEKHLYKLCELANDFNLENVFIHALTDGRDTDPKSGLGFIKELQDNIQNFSAQIASICGRYYTMDRDKRWERIKEGYDLMVNGIGDKTTDPVFAIKKSYDNGFTDEFIKPVVVTDSSGEPLTRIKNGDVVICFNFRTDRLRQITYALTQQQIPEFKMKPLNLNYLTLTTYDESFKNIKVVFDKHNLNNTIGEVLSKAGKTQIRIAETEKYAHVTFFFSGGREEKFSGEKRILIPSPKVPTYDLQPGMSAFLVKDAIIKELKKPGLDFVCLNFANADMVGHTGIYSAIKKAVETVSFCVGEVAKTAIENDYSVMIIADHGNAEYAINPDGTPNTAHTTNPVPIFLFDKEYKKISNGRLCDVAPTILKIMNIDIPDEMTGNVLV